MGNETGPEGGHGCAWCAGYKWGVDDKPKFVLTTVAGVVECEDYEDPILDGNGSYLLESFTTCGYGYSGPTHEVVWTPGGTFSRLICYDLINGAFWFNGWSAGRCADPFINLNHCYNYDPSEGGSANPTVVDGPCEIFNTYYGMFPEPYYEWEKWDLGNKKYMYRICDGTGRVNVLFKWDREVKLNI